MKAALIVWALICLAAIAPELARAQTGVPWNNRAPKDYRARVNLNVENLCRSSHTFELTKSPEMTWLAFTGQSRVRVPARQSRPVEVLIDTTGMEIDSYTGKVLVKCTDCGRELGCTPDFLDAQLKVIWSPAELQQLRQDQFIPNQVLVILNLDTPDAISRIVQQLETTYQLQRIKIFELRSISRAGVLFQILTPQVSMAVTVFNIQADPRVLFAQPNFIYNTLLHNDPLAGLQYGPQKIGADAAHRYSTGKGVRVAVVDTGVDFNHSDLKGRVIETANFTDGDTDFAEDAHGTLVAGVIAAARNNRIGIYGVAPDAQIIAIKVSSPKSKGSLDASGSSHTLVQGLDFAIGRDANVINLSMGGPKDPSVSNLVKGAFNKGIVTVAAAGNGGPQGQAVYPAAMEKVIGVSAVDSRDQLYESATRGEYIDLVAPGVEIMSTLPGNKFNAFTGTSMAAPHVSGAVAVILQRQPDLSPAQVRALLEGTARDLGAGGKDNDFGNGCLDLCRALEKLTGSRVCN